MWGRNFRNVTQLVSSGWGGGALESSVGNAQGRKIENLVKGGGKGHDDETRLERKWAIETEMLPIRASAFSSRVARFPALNLARMRARSWKWGMIARAALIRQLSF